MMGQYHAQTYLSYEYSKSKLEKVSTKVDLQEHVDKTSLEIYDLIASQYDFIVTAEEEKTSIRMLREKISGYAKGRVLEVCAGTGRNLKHYIRDAVSSLTLVDASSEMVKAAQAKIKKEDASFADSIVMDSRKLDFPDNSFDTVVQTFGICR